MMNKLIIKIMMVLFAVSLLGCEGTMKGVGEDLEKMGKSIKESVSSDKKSDDK